MIMHNTSLSIEIFTLDTKPVLFNDFGGSCQSLSWRHKHTKNESVSAKREHHGDFFMYEWKTLVGVQKFRFYLITHIVHEKHSQMSHYANFASGASKAKNYLKKSKV